MNVNDLVLTPSMSTLILRCPTCASDAADTLGVTGNFDGLLEATVVMRCEACSTVYLSPVAADATVLPLRQPGAAFTYRQINRWTRGLPPAARILCVDAAAGEILRARLEAAPGDWNIESTDGEHEFSVAGTAGRYELIVLMHSLESARDPNALLGRAANLLAVGGRIVAIVSNSGSSCFSAFGGRHWCGYRFPMTRQHFSPRALDGLAENAGLCVTETQTPFVPEFWLESTANWLRDWQAGSGIIRLFTGRWIVPWAVMSAIEAIAAARGRASLLVAQMERK